MLEKVTQETKQALEELLEVSKIKTGQLVVVGCSTSEVAGERIGTYSNVDLARAIFKGLNAVAKENGVYLAIQCCEHLNRCIIVENSYAQKNNIEQVNVVPQPKAGGSLATVAFEEFKEAVAVEEVKADCGIDIGGTLIGMHLKKVAVPVRLKIDKIGQANIICARTRAKFVGGERARYNEDLM